LAPRLKCKDKYCKDHEYKCKCKDRYSLTIADPEGQKGQPGPPGPPGIASFEIVDGVGGQIPDVTGYYGGTVYCSAGYKVTGGGFMQNDLNITLSGPYDFIGTGFEKIDNGWRVEGTVVTKVGETQAPSLRIWAVCVQVQ